MKNVELIFMLWRETERVSRWWFIQSLASLLNWIIKGPLTNEISLYLMFRQTLGQRKRLQMSPNVTKHVKPLRLRRLKHTLGVRVTMLTEATFSIMETRWQWLNSFLAMHRCLCDATGPGDEDAGTREMSSETRTDLSRCSAGSELFLRSSNGNSSCCAPNHWLSYGVNIRFPALHYITGSGDIWTPGSWRSVTWRGFTAMCDDGLW